eukprot:7300812-Pyramimonas_sp.AAC.1
MGPSRHHVQGRGHRGRPPSVCWPAKGISLPRFGVRSRQSGPPSLAPSLSRATPGELRAIS